MQGEGGLGVRLVVYKKENVGSKYSTFTVIV